MRNGTAPKVLKLFANEIGMDFEKCENSTATQEFELKEKDFSGSTEMRYVKF